jgi:hypothetical protein
MPRNTLPPSQIGRKSPQVGFSINGDGKLSREEFVGPSDAK